MGRQYKIVIDPGHGGSDPGAVANGLKEKDLTLKISLEVARLLKAAGFQVILTRDKDIDLPLDRRRTPDCDISVSIHINAGGGQGLETWVSLFNRAGESKKLGQAIQEQILRRVPFSNRGIKSKKNSAGNADYLYMLRNAKGVPVLVECGFIDSAVDVAILKSPDNIVKIAEGIAAGILEYCGINILQEVLSMFKDVPTNHWAAGSIERLAKLGIIAGDGQGNFRPDAPITRAEVVALLDRVLKLLGR